MAGASPIKLYCLLCKMILVFSIFVENFIDFTGEKEIL